MIEYAVGVERSRLRADGWADGIMKAVDDGRLEADDARSLFIDYIGPSLDTTILGAGHLLYLLGSHPEQHELVRNNPELVPATVHEALRIGSPVRAFTRYASQAYEVDGITVPEGERVLILYGAANRDERHYADPNRFDVTREARDHLAYGFGVHRCAGGHLAQIELEALLRALIERVSRIEVSNPCVLTSNMLNGYESFEASFR